MHLNKIMFIIRGKINSCIYNSQTGDIFHIDNKTLELALNDTLNNEDILRQLIKNHIFVDYETNWDGNIDILTKNKDFYHRFAWIEITNICNLKCIHCYNESDDSHNCNMSIENFILTINKLKSFGIRRIQIIGGEPLLHPDIIDMIEYAYKNMDFIEIFTNGTLLNDNLLKIIKKCNVKLAFSVYSYDKNQHDLVTNNIDSYSKTLTAISKAKKMNVEYRVARVIMKDINIGEKNTSLFTLSQKKDYVRLSGRANISLYDENMLENKLITKEFFKSKFKLVRFIENINVNRCFSKNLYVGVNMIVYPCVMERRINYGRIEKLSLDEIKNSFIIKINKDKIDSCKLCEFRYFCNDCRPDSIDNNIYCKPWFCTYVPEEGRWIEKKQFINQILNERS